MSFDVLCCAAQQRADLAPPWEVTLDLGASHGSLGPWVMLGSTCFMEVLYQPGIKIEQGSQSYLRS